MGQIDKLGSHIRCVVSVSMLTEGWDANTVTHIMGLRAFGSQLLCEQVAGRALRRMEYYLQSYDKDGIPTQDKRKIKTWKFPPEYAHIIGVPFKLFKGGTASPVDPPVYTQVNAIPERQKEHEIEFPNIKGYRVEYEEGELTFDFTHIENYEIDCSKFPLETTMASAFSPDQQIMEVKSVFEKRSQEIIYLLTKELINYHFSDDDGNPGFHKFNRLKTIVTYWYENKIHLLNVCGEEYKKLLYFIEPKSITDHIARGINPHLNTNAEGFYQSKKGEKKAYFHIGPRFGTVSRQAVNEAVKECRTRGDADWLIILGFSFESNIHNQKMTTNLGAFEVTKVRMHDDLLQEGLLKKDKKAASFVTIGEPDIVLNKDGNTATVEIRGLDIYDPIRDEVKARNVEDIAYWMVDTGYDGSNFVLRQVFFCGGKKDEFNKWKKGLDNRAKKKTKKNAESTLRIEIDEEAFDRLYGFISHPFEIKTGQKIAVRVISQFGEECMKVLKA